MAPSRHSKRQRAKDLREVLEAKRDKRALSNVDYKAEGQVLKREAPPIPTSIKEDQLKEAHQLLHEIKQAQLEAMTLFQGVEAHFMLMLNIANCLVEIGHFTLEDAKPYQNSYVSFEFQHCKYLVRAERTIIVKSQLLRSKKLVEKIVVASLEKLLWSDKGKDHVVIEDDEAKGESESVTTENRGLDRAITTAGRGRSEPPARAVTTAGGGLSESLARAVRTAVDGGQNHRNPVHSLVFRSGGFFGSSVPPKIIPGVPPGPSRCPRRFKCHIGILPTSPEYRTWFIDAVWPIERPRRTALLSALEGWAQVDIDDADGTDEEIVMAPRTGDVEEGSAPKDDIEDVAPRRRRDT
ncbi:hypothetical protein JCGZ_16393 [Jatropha curcas]|uniref:Uncharacterized protein n=1 Tax=Jatropha curcas TaxID=180498 RepID=A0A067K388_JATCU|nr:hypothetical protein JCGZ_16393 [Jatropha curcas]